MPAGWNALHVDEVLVYALNQMSVGATGIPLLDDQGRPTRVVSERGIVDALATVVAQDVFNLPLPHPWACHRIGRGRRGTDKPRHQPEGVNAGPDESERSMGTPIEVWGKEYKCSSAVVRPRCDAVGRTVTAAWCAQQFIPPAPPATLWPPGGQRCQTPR